MARKYICNHSQSNQLRIIVIEDFEMKLSNLHFKLNVLLELNRSYSCIHLQNTYKFFYIETRVGSKNGKCNYKEM